MKQAEREQATFAGGCFWCGEAVFQQVDGVQEIESGYTGGSMDNPTYEQVCSGETGHAEAIRITFDPNQVSYNHLLDVFFATHNPTTLNRQGADVGTQYRSVIFYHSDEQKQAAEAKIEALDEHGDFDSPVVTEVQPAGKWYPAEERHQNYYKSNFQAPYCQAVIAPKLKKLEKLKQDK